MPKTEKPYVAVYNITAESGVGIVDFEYGIEDYCVTEQFSPTQRKRTRNKIYTNKEGRAYIVKYGCKYYLDEFQKV